ncbi:PIN domain-containing protein [Nanoarchaeota archaeon]
MTQTEKITIIIDTNFLLIPAQFGVDIFEEIDKICLFPYEIAIIDKTQSELKGIAEEGSGGDKKAVKLALALLEAKEVKIIETETQKSYVDKILVEITSRSPNNYIIATQDKELKAKLAEKGIKTIGLRQKKYLQIQNP